jgi:superfamily II DNA/RNA helicase
MEAIKKIFDALSVGRSIIYVARKTTANALEDFMQSKGMECAALHAGIPKEIRMELYNDFR